jgi:hypothetical protein
MNPLDALGLPRRQRADLSGWHDRRSGGRHGGMVGVGLAKGDAGQGGTPPWKGIPRNGKHVTRSRSVAGAAAVLGFILLVDAPVAAAGVDCYGQTPTITGTSGPDNGTIDGTGANDVIMGLEGDDVIDGGGGNDIICAGEGDDTVTTHGGNDRIFGHDGDDNLSSGANTDQIDGGSDTDTCDAGPPGNEEVYGCTNPTKFLVGQKAPDFTARTAFDNKFRLSDLEGQFVMIDFSSFWCGPSSLMAPETATVQAALRAEGLPFTYVLAELQDNSPGNPTDRVDAEFFTERWSLYDLPVLHTGGAAQSTLMTQASNYASENLLFSDSSGSAGVFPTQVFINKRGKVTEVHPGLLTGEEIMDRYDPDFGDPGDVSQSGAPLPGRDIEDLIEEVEGLGLSADSEKTLTKPLKNALHALEQRLNPEVSPCAWLAKFRKALRSVNGLNAGERQSLSAGALAVADEIGCG